MWPNLQEPADLDTITEEILYGKLHFLRSAGSEYASNSGKNTEA